MDAAANFPCDVRNEAFSSRDYQRFKEACRLRNAIRKYAAFLSDAAGIVTEGLVSKLSKALSIPVDDIDTHLALHIYGVDSLLAVELRNWFAKDLHAEVAIFDIMGASSLPAVSMTNAGESEYRQASWVNVE